VRGGRGQEGRRGDGTGEGGEGTGRGGRGRGREGGLHHDATQGLHQGKSGPANRVIPIWNSLPDSVFSANTINTFKNRLDKVPKILDVNKNSQKRP